MSTNRPRPPSLILGGNQTISTVLAYTYFSTDEHGLELYDLAVADQWATVVDLKSVSGTLQFLHVAVDNNSGANRTYGARVMIDGNIVYNTRILTVANGTERSIAIAGVIFWDDTLDQPNSVAGHNYIFEQSLKIDVRMDSITNADLLAAYRYRLTGLMVS